MVGWYQPAYLSLMEFSCIQAPFMITEYGGCVFQVGGKLRLNVGESPALLDNIPRELANIDG